MKKNAIEHFYKDRAALFSGLQSHVEMSLQTALAQRTRASIAVSGGSTPAPLYQALSSSALDWHNIDITLTDERYVPPEHPNSNEAMLRRTLLVGAAADANFIALMQPSDSAEQAAKLSSALLQQLASPLDLVILGMGNDMHTASLFPYARELPQALASDQQQLCIALHPISSASARLSMSLNMLLNSREIVLLITGEKKRKTLQQALQYGSIEQAPIAAVLRQQKVPLHIYWSP